MVFDDDSASEPEKDSCTRSELVPPTVRSLTLALMLWQFLFNISDAALSVLLLCLYHFLKVLHTLSGNNLLGEWLVHFPSSLKRMHGSVIGDEIKFINYVVCRKCDSLYDHDDCIEKIGSKLSSKCCRYVEFPNHPMQRFRKECGTPLMYLSSKVNTFKAFKVYSYQPLNACYDSVVEASRIC